MTVKSSSINDKNQVEYWPIDASKEGQRLDNYLLGELKGIPKSLVYKIIRRGEVRINKKRVKASTRLQKGDCLRLPPLRLPKTTELPELSLSAQHLLGQSILAETEDWLILNKPSGWAVHGGSQVRLGLIESLRQLRGEKNYLELVHRLDKETSGCLLIAKNYHSLLKLQQALLNKEINKYYLALVIGKWPIQCHDIALPLKRFDVTSGGHKMRVVAEGKASRTLVKIVESFSQATLIEAQPISGRMHQIRVHTAYGGHSILADQKYGDQANRRLTKQLSLKRLFLHAECLTFCDPKTSAQIKVHAPLDNQLQSVLEQLRK